MSYVVAVDCNQVENAVQSLVSHLLSSSSTLPLKRLSSPTVTTSPPVTTSNIFCPTSAVTTRPQGSTASLPASSNAQLIRVIRRPAAEPITCHTVSSTADPTAQPVIFNLPLGNPGGLLIVRNPQPEMTVPVVTVSQPAMAHGWSQFMPQPDVCQPCSDAGYSQQLSSTNHSPPNSENFLLESPHISSKLSAAAVDIYRQSSEDNSVKNELNLDKASLDNSTFDISGFSTPIEAENFDSGDEIPVGEEVDLPGGISELPDDKSALPCDVLDDLLHIVSESLGPVVDVGPVVDEQTDTHTHTLRDYDLTLDNDASFISMVVSPDSKVPACTVRPDAELAKIMDYCPEWSYVEGGMKVLVAGSWHETDAYYCVLFDSVSVPATLVQHGLLRCYAPGL